MRNIRQASRRRRNGVAIALVMFFSIITLTFLYTMVFTRVERTRQSKTSLQFLKAHYLAQGGIQHALLKIRMLPNEIYDASCLQKGICPFDPLLSGAPSASANKHDGPNSPVFIFKQEINSDDFGGIRSHPSGQSYANWHYEIPNMRAVTIYRRAAGAGTSNIVHVLEIYSRASVDDKVYSKSGNMDERTEMVKKVVEIERI